MKKKIKIGFEDIAINLINFETKDKKDDNVLGEYDSSNAKIDIQKEQNARSEANTLLHEIIHACVYQAGLSSQGNLLFKEKNEELIVNAISNSLSQVFRDNKWFLPYLQTHLVCGKFDAKRRIEAIPKNKKSVAKRTLSKNRN
jgi:mannitol-specific phosphotransferase system IIBC component